MTGAARLSWSGGACNVTSASLVVPARGVWVAELRTDGDPPAEGASALLELGGVEWRGTVTRGGDFAGGSGVRLVAGGAGWGTLLRPKGYGSPAGVAALLVAQDAAREAGETLAAWGGAGTLGSHWTRPAGPASSSLEGLLGGGSWWVGADGLTYTGTRPTGPSKALPLELEAGVGLVTLAADELADVVPGLTVTDERLPGGSFVLGDLVVEWTSERVRVRAYPAAVPAAPSRGAAALEAIVERLLRRRLWGSYRYRVISQDGEEVALQALRRGEVPDLVRVSQWLGVPGGSAVLTPGAIVSVKFLEGDPSLPAVDGYAPASEGEASIPVSLSLCGGDRPVARVGDTVQVFLSTPAAFSGTISGAPAAGVVTWTTPVLGVISGGSSKVKA